MKFEELNIIPPILRALKNENYIVPTPIQEKAIPIILSGRDLLGCAQTGTGKTAAFAIPTIQLLDKQKISKIEKRKIRSLIITPTRELALQIYENFCIYGKYTDLKSCVIFGGVSQKPQEEKLKKGVDILIATPGRLNDLMNQKLINLDHIKIFILDEADRMLDMGFINDVKKIIEKIPAKKQTLLFSATMPPSIAKMSSSILFDPIKVEIKPETSTINTIEQYLYYVDKENKKDLLINILKDQSILSALVFVRTRHGADTVVRQLAKANIKAEAIHSDKSQNMRQAALNDFKNKKLRVLIATDIAARGIDIDELSHVINFELPEVPETYVHRIGRTGRAGLGGVAISFCNYDEKVYLATIEKLIGKRIKEIKDNPYPLLDDFPTVKAAKAKRGSFSSHTEALKSASSTKKKLRMTADGTLKEKRNSNARSTNPRNDQKTSSNRNR